MLDDIKKISEVDKSNQIDNLEKLPYHINQSIKIAQSNFFDKLFKINNIIFNGIGGSAISGDIIKSLLWTKLNIPIFVNRNNIIPKWANKNSLVITQSYSGNTEETINFFKQAYQRKCKMISISSGGKLEKYSENRGIIHIKIPTGLIPRNAVSYFIFIPLIILDKTGLTSNIFKFDINEILQITKDVIRNNNKKVKIENNQSKKIAIKIFNTIPQIYGWGIFTAIAKRWSTQFNENSKLISKYDIIPESNHNDIVGWSQNYENTKKFSCFLFRDKALEDIYMSKRLDFMRILYSDLSANLIEIHNKGNDSISKLLYLISLGDYISCYTAILREIDPTPVSVIDELKDKIQSI
jgi:glucose/mannose-6-phosphate isomerase